MLRLPPRISLNIDLTLGVNAPLASFHQTCETNIKFQLAHKTRKLSSTPESYYEQC